jgi:hypothetical protein
MIDAPEAPHQHHPAHTGRRWLDISLALSAMFVSVVSLIVAVEHGRTMERMADANTKMVEANSWPFISFDTHDLNEQGHADVRLVLTNEGIGPARIETFELWWNGKPISSPSELMKACCLTTPALEEQLKKTADRRIGLASPRILRAGEHVDFLTLSYNKGNDDLFSKFDVERDKIKTRVCFCSVFDECWVQMGGLGVVTDEQLIHPSRVNSCAAPATPYQVDLKSARDERNPTP